MLGPPIDWLGGFYIYVWPDGEWCHEDELEEKLAAPCAKSDDFKRFGVVFDDDEEVEEFVQGEIAAGRV